MAAFCGSIPYATKEVPTKIRGMMATRWAPTSFKSFKWGYNPTYSCVNPIYKLVGAHLVYI